MTYNVFSGTLNPTQSINNGIKYAAFKWKDAIFGFPVSPGSAEAELSEVGK